MLPERMEAVIEPPRVWNTEDRIEYQLWKATVRWGRRKKVFEEATLAALAQRLTDWAIHNRMDIRGFTMPMVAWSAIERGEADGGEA